MKQTKNKLNKTAFKAYFFMFLFGYILLYASFKPSTGWYINFPFFILNLVAFFAFAWDKKILDKQFWQIAFIASLVIKVSSLIIYLIYNDILPDQFSLSFTFLFFIQLFIPLFFRFIPFYLYAFKSKEIWSNDQNLKTSK